MTSFWVKSITLDFDRKNKIYLLCKFIFEILIRCIVTLMKTTFQIYKDTNSERAEKVVSRSRQMDKTVPREFVNCN